MISIAITGGIGSGKSYISNILQEYGIPIYNTDDEAKRLMVSDEGIRHDLVTLLGEEVYVGGTLNKALLASYLFADDTLEYLYNGILRNLLISFTPQEKLFYFKGIQFGHIYFIRITGQDHHVSNLTDF